MPRQGTLESLNLGLPPKRKKANPLSRLQQATLLSEGTGTLQEKAQERGLGTSVPTPGAIEARKKKKKPNKNNGEGFPNRSPY